MKLIPSYLKLLFFSLLFFSFFSAKGQNQSDSLLLLDTCAVYFDFGKHHLRVGADTLLGPMARRALNKARLHIFITAHTDAIGSNRANDLLSRRRAESVRTYLLEQGLKANKVTITAVGEHHPVSSNNTEEGRQLNRRATVALYYKQEMVKITGQIRDAETGEGVLADIVIHTKKTRDSLTTDKDGNFEQEIPDSTVFGIDIYAKGYFFDTQVLRALKGKMPKLEVSLPPIKVGEAQDIKNLFFVGNQAILLERSRSELPKILRFMQINDSIRIEIAGHINRPFTPPDKLTEWEQNLSVRRALLIYDFLIKNGIDASRLTYKGYGNSQMRYPRATNAKQQEMNRRVEIRILETGKILSEDPE